jgi:hypothetical protein
VAAKISKYLLYPIPCIAGAINVAMPGKGIYKTINPSPNLEGVRKI